MGRKGSLRRRAMFKLVVKDVERACEVVRGIIPYTHKATRVLVLGAAWYTARAVVRKMLSPDTPWLETTRAFVGVYGQNVVHAAPASSTHTGWADVLVVIEDGMDEDMKREVLHCSGR